MSHVDRKKLRLPFARILEAIRFAIHVKNMGVIGQTIYQCRNQCGILEQLRPFGKLKIDRNHGDYSF